MADENDDLRQAMSKISHIADSWRASTAPNSPITGLNYDELSKFIATIPARLISLENKHIIEKSNEIIGYLPILEFEDGLADRETIVVNSRLLLLKDAINDLSRAARRSGFYDPEAQVFNVAGPEATELLQGLKDKLAEVELAIDNITKGLAKKNVDSGISIGVPGVSVNLSKALSFINDHTREAREYLEANSAINIASLRKRLDKIAAESTTISSFIKDKIRIFGSKMAAAAKRLDLLAHQALSSGLKLARSVLKADASQTKEKVEPPIKAIPLASQYIYANYLKEISKYAISLTSIRSIENVHLRQRKIPEENTNHRYWLTMTIKYRTAMLRSNLLGAGSQEISFSIEPWLVSIFAAYRSETIAKFVKDAISNRGRL